MPKIKDVTGIKFGSLTVNHFHSIKNRKAYWVCECDCGNVILATYGNLKSGNTKSCGANIHRQKHNMCDTRIYRIWKNMKNRCVCPNANHYDRYGGRGISYYPEWEKFENFYNWSIGNGYSDKLTLDRINNDGNYVPDNCRWITQKEQMSNTKNNVYVEVNGERKTLKQWSEKLGINYKTIENRYNSGDRGERFIRPLEEKYSSNIKMNCR